MAAMKRSVGLVLAAAVGTQALNERHVLNQSIPATTTFSGTPIENPTAFATPFVLNVEDMWDMLVGPVSSASISTTISPRPIPTNSLIPPPPLYYSPFPSGAQYPMEMKNESWSFPKDFFWGVAGAAYQVEGAVKTEGRGPSVWDVLTHRVDGFVAETSEPDHTADITNNNYYMYKDGRLTACIFGGMLS